MELHQQKRRFVMAESFPVVLRGYDKEKVDRAIADLEQSEV